MPIDGMMELYAAGDELITVDKDIGTFVIFVFKFAG